MVRIEGGILLVDYTKSPLLRRVCLFLLNALIEETDGDKRASLTHMREAVSNGEFPTISVDLVPPPPPKVDLADVLRRGREKAASRAASAGAAAPVTPRRPTPSPDRVTVPSASPGRARYEAKKPDTYNTNDLYFVLYDAWKEKWPASQPGSFTMQDRANGKRLIEDYGAAIVARVIVECVRKWEVVQQRFNVRGHPSMGVFFGFRNSLFPFIMDDLSDTPRAKGAGSQHNPKNSRPKGHEEGWD